MHRTRKRTRSVIATLASMMLLTGMVAMVAAPAAANHETGGGQPGTGPVGVEIKNPGPVVFELTGGLISVSNGTQEFDLGGDSDDVEVDPDAEPVTLTGTVDKDGNVHIPAANVSFPEVELPEQGVTVQISSPVDVTGHLNIWTGEMEVFLQLNIRIDTGFLAVCTLNLPMNLSTENEGGTRYARNTGTVGLADNTFAIPQTQRSGLLAGIACPVLEGEFGIPSPSGTNSAVLEFQTDPAFKFKAVGVGLDNITASVCEGELGGEWNNAKGVQSCTTENWVVTIVTSPVLNTGGSGTARWRATGQQVTSTLIQTTDSQQGVVGGHGTDDTAGSEDVELDQEVEVNVVTCQQGPSIGSNFQNRPLDSAQCVNLVNNWAATL